MPGCTSWFDRAARPATGPSRSRSSMPAHGPTCSPLDSQEVNMGSTETSSEAAAGSAPPKPGEVRLEVVSVPVADVDRAKTFYAGLGWREDADIAVGENFRVVQFTPPRSGCSISFGTGVPAAQPGSFRGSELAVYDIDAVREDLISRGVEVGEVFHLDGGPVPGPDPQGRSYQTFASFSDPDGNEWRLQEIKERLPGRWAKAAGPGQPD